MTEGTTDKPTIPHAKAVIVFTGMMLAAYFCLSLWVLFYSTDDTIRGAVLGNWGTMAAGAATFWFGSSSGGKLAK